jgi:hypothetical protein
LKPGGVRIPRAFRSHKSRDGFVYRSYTLSMLARLGPLPAHAEPTLREAGRCVVELEALARELEIAKAGKRRRDITRCRKVTFMTREQLARLERRLEELAPPKSARPMDALKNAPEAMA